MTNYPAGDFLIQIKNAARTNKREISVKSTKYLLEVAKVFEKEGILDGVRSESGKLTANISYHKKEPVLMDLKLVSKPGLRKYMGVDEIKSRKRARSTFLILSTPQGVMSSREAYKKNIGGEVIVEIW